MVFVRRALQRVGDPVEEHVDNRESGRPSRGRYGFIWLWLWAIQVSDTPHQRRHTTGRIWSWKRGGRSTKLGAKKRHWIANVQTAVAVAVG